MLLALTPLAAALDGRPGLARWVAWPCCSRPGRAGGGQVAGRRDHAAPGGVGELRCAPAVAPGRAWGAGGAAGLPGGGRAVDRGGGHVRRARPLSQPLRRAAQDGVPLRGVAGDLGSRLARLLPCGAGVGAFDPVFCAAEPLGSGRFRGSSITPTTTTWRGSWKVGWLAAAVSSSLSWTWLALLWPGGRGHAMARTLARARPASPILALLAMSAVDYPLRTENLGLPLRLPPGPRRARSRLTAKAEMIAPWRSGGAGPRVRGGGAGGRVPGVDPPATARWWAGGDRQRRANIKPIRVRGVVEGTDAELIPGARTGNPVANWNHGLAQARAPIRLSGPPGRNCCSNLADLRRAVNASPTKGERAVIGRTVVTRRRAALPLQPRLRRRPSPTPVHRRCCPW